MPLYKNVTQHRQNSGICWKIVIVTSEGQKQTHYSWKESDVVWHCQPARVNSRHLVRKPAADSVFNLYSIFLFKKATTFFTIIFFTNCCGYFWIFEKCNHLFRFYPPSIDSDVVNRITYSNALCVPIRNKSIPPSIHSFSSAYLIRG